ncbi:MAG TPA: hypothetical protein ENG98_00025, partial [Actinobacteria bacterium]|nr:hypothetical protein [Actinomycetota bacterium]
MVALKTQRLWMLAAVMTLIVTACTSVSDQPAPTTLTVAQPTTSVIPGAEQPTGSPGVLTVTETRQLPVTPVGGAVTNGVVWLVGYSDPASPSVFAVGVDFLDVFEAGILPWDVAVGPSGTWVANGSGEGTLYNASTGQGPGFPLENSVQRVGSSPLVVALERPDDVAIAGDWLWVLRSGGGDEGVVVTQVDESSGDILGTIELAGSGGELVVVDGIAWVAATDGRENESWLLYELVTDP